MHTFSCPRHGPEQTLPGASRSEDGRRLRGRREIVVSGVQFSGTGREWAAATSDGLLLYALADDLLFAPVGLEVRELLVRELLVVSFWCELLVVILV